MTHANSILPLVTKTATISPCGLFRLRLERRWGKGPSLPWCLLNPSRADAQIDDPTSKKVVEFTRRATFDGAILVNVCGLRATNPAELLKVEDPFGPFNDDALREVARDAAAIEVPIVCAWGTGGWVKGAGDRALAIFADAGVSLLCLGVNADGSPKHPLYVPYQTALQTYRPRAAA